MNREGRRALERFIRRRSRAEQPQRDAELDERLAKLEVENASLKAQVAGLEQRHDQLPGVTAGRKDWHVLVGGERVDIRAIPPAEWLRTVEELPEFLFTFAVDRLDTSKATPAETVERVVALAKRWITACAADPVDLDRLTVPEAEHAVAHIAELNGVTAHLAAWFRQRLARVATPAPSSQSLRPTPVEPPGDLPN